MFVLCTEQADVTKALFKEAEKNQLALQALRKVQDENCSNCTENNSKRVGVCIKTYVPACL